MKKFYIGVALLSLLGLADALYLTIEHVTGQTVRCTILSGCSEVLSSPYAVVAGIPLAARYSGLAQITCRTSPTRVAIRLLSGK